jgi:hypothetical protein
LISFSRVELFHAASWSGYVAVRKNDAFVFTGAAVALNVFLVAR